MSGLCLGPAGLYIDYSKRCSHTHVHTHPVSQLVASQCPWQRLLTTMLKSYSDEFRSRGHKYVITVRLIWICSAGLILIIKLTSFSLLRLDLAYNCVIFWYFAKVGVKSGEVSCLFILTRCLVLYLKYQNFYFVCVVTWIIVLVK